jgi:hypothetical protein
MSEPIPDRFKELIDALETEQEREQLKTRHPKQDKRS